MVTCRGAVLATVCVAALVSLPAAAGSPTPEPQSVSAQHRSVSATVETTPVASSGDAADDPAIWIHPTRPSRSLVIGNDKGGALDVYDLQGRLLQRIREGFFGNVDVRSPVRIGSTTHHLVAVSRAGLRLYSVDPDTRRLRNVTDAATGSLRVPSGGEGLCLYRQPRTGAVFVFLISRPGGVSQYRLHDTDDDGLVEATRVRRWALGSEAEGCVADDELGHLFIAEEDVALWRYGARPGAGTAPSQRIAVDRVTSAGGRLAADIEGLAIVRTGGGGGYLLASAQAGSATRNFFAVYERAAPHRFVRTFQVTTGGQTDGCGRTDGIDAVAADLGPGFRHGLFVCQDGKNTAPASVGNQNFKLVPLERVTASG